MILSLFDYTGIWSDPYRATDEVVQVDIQHGRDIYDIPLDSLEDVRGIIAQPPCTDFALSGARWFAAKDADGRTLESMRLVIRTLRIIEHFQPDWWVIENPMSRIHKCVPALGGPVYKFSPHEFGEDYRKTTWLWGKFNPPVKLPREQWGEPRDVIHRMAPGPDRANKRSATSTKFAAAWYKENP